MSPRSRQDADILTTPKDSLRTPKFYQEINGGLTSVRSPRYPHDLDSLNTPKVLTTPKVGIEDLLSTPTLTTPKTCDFWKDSGQLFSPLTPGGHTPSTPREPPKDLPLDSSIGLSSPCDGVLAKRRKLTKLHSTNSRSLESDSNSCDTPTTEQELFPKDLSKRNTEKDDDDDDNKREDSNGSHLPSIHDTYRREDGSLSPVQSEMDRVRHKVGAVAISASPKRFKHPNKILPEALKLSKEFGVDVPSSYHPSPLAVPSPNWTAISAFMTSEGLALKTPKVLDNFVFDVLPPNTPNTPKIGRERSPENQGVVSDRQKYDDPRHARPKTEQRVTFADQPRIHTGTPPTPPPPYPEDLSMPHKSNSSSSSLVEPKQEYREQTQQPEQRDQRDQIKEEPREYPVIPPGFPPYYLHPGITPHHVYSGSPPASPPRVPNLPTNLYQHYQQRQLYADAPRHPGLSAVLEMAYDSHNHSRNYNVWQSHSQESSPAPPHVPTTWPIPSHHHPTSNPPTNSYNIKPNLANLALKEEQESQEINQRRKSKQEDDSDIDPSQQPPKKRGKGKGKNNIKELGGPKRVFTCPHCQRSYDWNYNLNRHLKYECGKENAFMCSKCGRRFPHKQNCVYHLKRKHKIVCETIDQYVANGLVLFKGSIPPPGQGDGHTSPGPPMRHDSMDSPHPHMGHGSPSDGRLMGHGSPPDGRLMGHGSPPSLQHNQ